MPTFLQRLMSSTDNLPVIEILRHAKSWQPAKDNPGETSVLSCPQWSAKQFAEHKAQLEDNVKKREDLGVYKLEVVPMPGGKIAAIMRIKTPHNEVNEAIKAIRKTTNPTRVVSRGPSPSQRPKGESRQKYTAAGA